VTDYIARSIRALKRFARQYGLVVIVVAHPTKDVGRDGKARPVTLYDVEGSAHWFNKCDHGVVITRVPDTHVTEVYVAKVRLQETGEIGTVKLRFDRFSGRFELLGDAGAPEMAA
jgi:twinkle protein